MFPLPFHAVDEPTLNLKPLLKKSVLSVPVFSTSELLGVIVLLLGLNPFLLLSLISHEADTEVFFKSMNAGLNPKKTNVPSSLPLPTKEENLLNPFFSAKA